MSGHTGLFRGLPALLRARLRLAVVTMASLGLGLGLLIGWGQAMGDADARDRFAVLASGLVLATLIAPVLASAHVTWGTQSGSRREEMLALPLGRLVIPTHVLLLGLLGLAAGGLSWFSGLALTQGLDALLEAASGERVACVLAIGAGCFVGVTYLCSIANHAAALSLAWLVVPFALLVCMQSMGHRGWEVPWLGVWMVTLGGAWLGLPFLLYAGPRHTWATSRVLDPREGATLLAGGGAALALVALGLLGAGWVLALVLAGTALAVQRAWRRARPGSRGAGAVPLLRAQTVMLLACLPPMALGLFVDGQRVGALESLAGTALEEARVAPSGSFVAAQVVLLGDQGSILHGERLTRVAVCDLTGRTPPRLVGRRFGHLAGWSRDGRYVAVHERAVGRLACSLIPLPLTSSRWRLLDGLQALVQSAGETLVLDTLTGHVQSLPPAQVAPGWADPQDLVRGRPDLWGHWVLEDGRGRRTTLPISRGDLTVQEYRPEGVLLALRRRGTTDELLLWGEGEPTAWSPPASPARSPWRVRQPRDGSAVLQIGRPGEPPLLEIPDALVARVGPDWALVTEPSGLIRYALPGAERRQLLPGTVAFVRQTLRGRSLVERHGEQVEWFEVDGPTGAVEPRPVAAGCAVEWAGDPLYLLRGPAGYLVQDEHGALRPLR